MNIKISEKAGFCFGVKRAMGLAWRELCDEHDKQTYALGPLIHNKQAVEKYEERGLITADDIEEIPSDVKMIIRSHGVSKSIYDRAEEKGLDVVDTTCPFVKKIHDIVKENYDNGKKIILIGDKNHPEVIGINGWCKNTAITIKTIEEAEVLELNNDKSYCAVAQTTMNLEVYRKIVEILKTKADDIDHGAGIILKAKMGDYVKKGDVLGVLYASEEEKFAKAEETLLDAYSIKDEKPVKSSIIHKVI